MKSFKNIFSFSPVTISLAIVFLGCLTITFSSCEKNNPNSPGVEYMPDMYRSPSLEDNSMDTFFADSMANRLPVTGTIPRGFTPDPYPNTPVGWDSAAIYLKDPFPATAAIQAQGKVLFDEFCIHCHGAKGMGDGPVAKHLPGPPPPYSGPALRNITVGTMYQTLEYGKGLMGSHASQLTPNERWKIIRYVQVLQKIGSDSTKASS